MSTEIRSADETTAPAGSITVDGIVVSWAHSDSVSPLRRAQALAMLSPREAARFAGTVDPAAGERFLLGRLLLRELAAEITGVKPANVRIDARCVDCGGPHGRPVLVAPVETAGSLRLSVSHCSSATVVAAARDRAIGIDVEPVAGSGERESAILSVTAGDFTDQHAVARDPLLHWTRVEAVLKADGRGLRIDPGLVQIRRREGGVEGRIGDDARRYRLAELALHPALRVSVAIAGRIAG